MKDMEYGSKKRNSYSKPFIIGIVFVDIILIITAILIFVTKYIDSDTIPGSIEEECYYEWQTYQGKQPGSIVKLLLANIIQNYQKNFDKGQFLFDLTYQLTSEDSGNSKYLSIGQSDKPDENVLNTLKDIRSNIDVNNDYIIEVNGNAKEVKIETINIICADPTLKNEEEILKEKEEVSEFNSRFEQFSGKKHGISVETLVTLLRKNYRSNYNDDRMLVDLLYEVEAEDAGHPKIFNNNASIVLNTKIDSFFRQLYYSILEGHDYYVEVHYNSVTGYIDSIGIFYNEPSGTVLIQDVDDDNPLTYYNKDALNVEPKIENVIDN